jgi:hypothetical protein
MSQFAAKQHEPSRATERLTAPSFKQIAQHHDVVLVVPPLSGLWAALHFRDEGFVSARSVRSCSIDGAEITFGE